MSDEHISKLTEQALAGGPARYRDKLSDQGKLFVRERLRLLLDVEPVWSEDGLLANALAGDLAADGIVTGVGSVLGRPTCVMANDPTVKAGSWGARTVEKIVRITETALRHDMPIVYLVDSAGARITDQVQLFPGRRGAGKIFANQVRLSGRVPQVCCLFGPSAAGGAYIPSFCDVVIMVEGNASMYLGSARMVEMVTREKTTLEEMGGARLHATISGCGSHLVKSDEEAIARARRWLSYFPANWRQPPPITEPVLPSRSLATGDVPPDERKVFDMRKVVVDALVDEGSVEEFHPHWARELLCALARIDGEPVGVVASQPMVKGGVLFVDSADKGARFIWLCDAFNIPLVFLADVPGFMVGTQVEKEGIIRSGAKMITAVSEATVPKISVIVRKAYGAGLYAMCGPAFDPEACLALPTAKIAVMGAEAAINAVYFNHIEALPEDERGEFVAQKRAEYEEDIDIARLASEMVIDAVVPAEALRDEVARRLAQAAGRRREFTDRRHGVPPG